MKPTYQVRVWQEDEWWLARVVAASEGADSAPLNAITQARSLAKIESMARDLIATILDADEGTFDAELEYVLPDDVGDLVCQAKGARAWLDAAQELWQERSTAAARALADKGYSLRETATLLGLSHQRVDQLLGGHADKERSKVWVYQCKSNWTIGRWHPEEAADPRDIYGFLVIQLAAQGDWCAPQSQHMDASLRDRVKAFLLEAASRVSRGSDAPELEGMSTE